MEVIPIFFPSLQPDTLLLIFHKLPNRYVLRCKVVCKQWRCLISDPLFTSNYNLINQPLTLILLPPPSSPLPALSYEIDGSDESCGDPLVGQPWPLPHGFDGSACVVRVVGSYNGVVALYQEVGLFCLFHPCTKEEKLVRVPPTDEYYNNFCGVNVDCVTGLCHDPDSDEYKVVVTLSSSSPCLLLVSFKDDENSNWEMKTKSGPEDLCSPLVCRLGTTVQGVPHWIYRAGSILYFDWRAEEYRMAKLPKGVEIEHACWDDDDNWKVEMKAAPACGLGALDGQLTVALLTSKGRCEVWALKEYGYEDSWRLLFVMSDDDFRPTFTTILSWRKDDWVVFMFDEDDQDELMVYDIRMRRLRPVRLNNWRKFFPKNNMIAYFPSLVSATID